MIPQHRHIKERWEMRFILTCALLALLMFTGFESAAVTATLVIGYIVTIALFDYWLSEAIDNGM